VPDQCPPSTEYKDHTVLFLFKFDCTCNPTCVSAIMCPIHLFQCHCISCAFVSVPLHILLTCVRAIASPTHMCQCHCPFCSLVSVPLHLPLICVSANASPTHLCQCHCISRSFVSVPLHIPLTCVRAIASPAHLCQCHCISSSFVSVPLCQVQVYSGRGSGQGWTKTDEGQRQGAGQEVSPAGVGDRLDSMTKDNEC